MRVPLGTRKGPWSRPGTPRDPFTWDDATAAGRLRRLVEFRRSDVVPAVVALATITYTVFAIVLGPGQPPGLPHSGRAAGPKAPDYVLVPTSAPDESATGSGDPTTATPATDDGGAGQPTAGGAGPAGATTAGATQGTASTTRPHRNPATDHPTGSDPAPGSTTSGTPGRPSTTTPPSAPAAAPASTTSRPVPTSTSRAAAPATTRGTVAPVGNVTTTTTSAHNVPGGGTVDGGVTAGTLQPGSTISLRATTACCTGRFISRRAGQLVTTVVTPFSSPLDQHDATWVVRRGLADPSCLSFESRYAAGTFLRHSSFRVFGQTTDGSGLFRADATFCPTGGKNGQGTSFVSYNYPTKLLRHYNNQLFIAANGGSNVWDTPALWADDVSWVVTSPWGS